MNKKNKIRITIEFDNPECAEHFASWLCGAGEQDYWQWMECREEEEEGNITAIKFNYHGPGQKLKFLEDGIVRTKAGRLDKDD